MRGITIERRRKFQIHERELLKRTIKSKSLVPSNFRETLMERRLAALPGKHALSTARVITRLSTRINAFEFSHRTRALYPLVVFLQPRSQQRRIRGSISKRRIYAAESKFHSSIHLFPSRKTRLLLQHGIPASSLTLSNHTFLELLSTL